LTRSYLAKRFATWFRERYTLEIPRDEDDVTVREAAALLRRHELTVYRFIREGQLHVKPDRTTILCRAGYPREGLVLSRKEVQELRQKLLAKHGPVATRARKIHAVAVLRELLEDGHPHLRIEVVDAALRKGVGHREIHHAKKTLKVNVTGGRRFGPSLWQLRGRHTRKPAAAIQPAPTPAPSGDDGAATPKSRRGPKGKKRTREMYEFCYVELRLKGRKRRRVWADVCKNFGGAPEQDRRTSIYAKRFAEKNGYPIEPSDSVRTELLDRVAKGNLATPER
jgi:hypothetical protein